MPVTTKLAENPEYWELSAPRTVQVATASLATGASINYAGWLAANPKAAGQAADQDHDNDGVPNGVECFLGGAANTTGFTHLPGVDNTAGTRSVTRTKGAGYTGTYDTN